MKTLLIVALIATGIFAAGRGNMMPSFADFDANGDAQVTKAEFTNAQQERMARQAEAGRMMRNAANAPTFDSIDTNRDGIIDAKEFQTHQLSNRRGGGRGMGGGQGMNP